MTKQRRALCLLSFALFLLACGESASPDELLALGPHPIGHRAMTVSYSAAVSGETRELPIRVWYPAAPDSGADPAVYAVGGIVELPPGRGQALDAPPPAEGPFPVAIYSHGNGGDNLLAYPYAELFASHGWVVVAPNHVGNTAVDSLGGTSVPFAQSALDRPNDVRAVLDWLESGLAGDALDGLADTSRVFVFGHSFGGYTTFATAGATLDVDAMLADCAAGTAEPRECAVLDDPDVVAALRAGFLDTRVDAIGAQAPGLVSGLADGTLAAIDVPAMLMTGHLDQLVPEETEGVPAWMGLDGEDDLWVEMPTGAHYSYVTICTDLTEDLLLLFRPNAPNDGCGPEMIPTTEAVPVLAAYLLGFARLHVLGEQRWGGVLTGPPFHAGFELRAR